MLNAFYIDPVGGYSVSWNDFLSQISHKKNVNLNFKTENNYHLFLELACALVHGFDFELVDAEWTEEEYMRVSGRPYVPTSHPCKPVEISKIDDLISKFKQSNSKIIFYSSGTTGAPKKISHDFGAITRFVKFNSVKKQCWAFTYSPTHMAGVQVLFEVLGGGSTLIDLYQKSRGVTLAAFEKYNITHISATPTFYRLLAPYNFTIYGVKRLTLGGEKSEETLLTNLKRSFPNAKLNNIFAMTETGSLFSSHGEGFIFKSGLEKVCKIQNGALFVNKEFIGKIGKDRIQEEWYNTGDLVEWIDKKKGTFMFVSRDSDCVNVGGYKINLIEVEDSIRSIEGIHDSRVYAKANSVLGTIIGADVLKDIKTSITSKYIRDELKRTLQEYKIPRIIKLVDHLDRTRAGKLKR